jgi:hypothetical protein
MIQIGAIAMIAIPALTLGTSWIDDWGKVRKSLADSQKKLKDLEINETTQAGLLSVVPVLEPPQEEEVQKPLFREKLYEHLKKAGINTEPLQFLPIRKVKDHRVLKIQCKGKCKLDQLLDLLAGLRENPYLVGIEELKIECDTKQPPDKRQEVGIALTVSTFVK